MLQRTQNADELLFQAHNLSQFYAHRLSKILIVTRLRLTKRKRNGKEEEQIYEFIVVLVL
jgi:hypothetical protein